MTCDLNLTCGRLCDSIIKDNFIQMARHVENIYIYVIRSRWLFNKISILFQMLISNSIILYFVFCCYLMEYFLLFWTNYVYLFSYCPHVFLFTPLQFTCIPLFCCCQCEFILIWVALSSWWHLPRHMERRLTNQVFYYYNNIRIIVSSYKKFYHLQSNTTTKAK